MGIRQQRLADEIKDIIALAFQAGTLEDPRLKGVTITATKLSSDLQICYVYFRLYDKKELKKAERGLENVSGLLKRRLAERLLVRKIPSLKFLYDESVEQGADVERLLERIRNED